MSALVKEPTLLEGGGNTNDPLPPVWDTDDERPYGFCGLCDRPIWDADDACGPYASARTLGIVCSDCAPFVTRGVL